MANPVTHTWAVRPSYCPDDVAARALDRIRQNPAEAGFYADHEPLLADVLDACPTDSPEAAADYLANVTCTDVGFVRALRVHARALRHHGLDAGQADDVCGCRRRAWTTFHSESAAALAELAPPDTGYQPRWVVYDVTNSRQAEDFVGTPTVEKLVAMYVLADATPDEDPSGRLPQLLELTAAPGEATLTIRVNVAPRTFRLELLSRARCQLAEWLSGTRLPADSRSIAETARAVDDDVATAVVRLCRADIFTTEGGRTYLVTPLIARLSRIKAELDPEQWQTLVRLSENWTQTIAELVDASAAVLTPMV